MDHFFLVWHKRAKEREFRLFGVFASEVEAQTYVTGMRMRLLDCYMVQVRGVKANRPIMAAALQVCS